jgi:hypothetical protein
MYEGNKREKEIVGVIKAPIKVNKYEMDCILSGAFEGGSNYWANRVRVINKDYKGAEFASEVISNGGKLDIYVDEYGDGSQDKRYRLTQKKLLKGCQLYVTGTKSTKPRAFDIDRWDSDDHDMILQYSLFGDVIYG